MHFGCDDVLAVPARVIDDGGVIAGGMDEAGFRGAIMRLWARGNAFMCVW